MVSIKVNVRVRFYLLWLFCFGQACCHRHLGSKINTAYFVLRATGRSGTENKLQFNINRPGWAVSG